MIRIFVAIGLMGAPLGAVHAKSHSWQVGNDSFHIYYSDLDMTTVEGRASFLYRVERAANRLCRDRIDRIQCAAATVELASRNTRILSRLRE